MLNESNSSSELSTSKELVPLTPRTAGEKIRDHLRSTSVSGFSPRPIPTKSQVGLYQNQIYPFVVVLVPAHNEEKHIAGTITSLLNQTRPPDEIVVIADNCSDSTVAIALSMGVNVVETHQNQDLKAGALNSVIEKILPMLDETDSILVMDADTHLSPDFIRAAMRVLFKPLNQGEKAVAGVGGIFLGIQEKWSIITQLQTNEYLRYQRRLGRRRGRALVLTGTGTMFNIRTLRQVVDARKNGRFPNIGTGLSVYDTASMTEDNELTLCAKRLNYRVLSPKECTVETAMMPDLKSLYRQRRRWQRGALENLYAHGIDSHTLPYIIRQAITYAGVWFLALYLTTLTYALVTRAELPWTAPLWLGVFTLYIIEQTFSVRKGGWRAILVSISVLPEILYNFFLNFVYVVCLQGVIFAIPDTWGRMRDSHASTATHLNVQRKTGINGHRDIRRTPKGRIRAIAIEATKDLATVFLLSIPFWNIQLAWNLIAAYVLAGSIATLARLVPVKFS